MKYLTLEEIAEILSKKHKTFADAEADAYELFGCPPWNETPERLTKHAEGILETARAAFKRNLLAIMRASVNSGKLIVRDRLSLLEMPAPTGDHLDRYLKRDPTWWCVVSEADADAYFEEQGVPYRITEKAEPLAMTEHAWKAEAQKRAAAILAADLAAGLIPSKRSASRKIAADFRREGINGPRGAPPSAGTIEKHALRELELPDQHAGAGRATDSTGKNSRR